MQLQRAGKYVVYDNKSYQFKINETYIKMYGDETDNFKKYVLDHEVVNTSLGERRINYDTPITIYSKNVAFSDITSAYDLRYKALYQGEEFSAGVSSYPQIILFAGTFDYGASATTTIKGFEIEAGNWVKKVDISEVTLIPIKTPIDLSQYLPS